MTYWLVRILLIAATFAALGVIAAAFVAIGPREKESWAVLAAALAVLTSVAASWSSQRVLELQQAEHEPYPYPSIDVTGRYGLLQLRVTNFGGGAARDVRIEWAEPLLNSKGEAVRFTHQQGGSDIPVLLPKESVAVLIDGHVNFYQAYKSGANYSGHVLYKDSTGRTRREPFFVSAEKYRHALTYGEESIKTQYQLQQLPDKIDELTAAVTECRTVLEKALTDKADGDTA